MNDLTLVVRNMVRQALVLIAIIGLTFAAGINWAEAATPQVTNAGASPLPVILIFMATIGILFQLMASSQKPARVRARRIDRHRS